MIYKSGTMNLRNSQIGSSSCQCSTVLIAQEKETMRFVFRIHKKPRRTRRNSRRDTGRSSVLEMKRSGMELSITHLKENGALQPLNWWNDSKIRYGNRKYKFEGKWNSVASQMVQQFKETGHTVFTSASTLSRGILRMHKGKETVHISTPISSSSSSWSQNSTWWNSQHWDKSQQWREWQPEEWQDLELWEKW